MPPRPLERESVAVMPYPAPKGEQVTTPPDPSIPFAPAEVGGPTAVAYYPTPAVPGNPAQDLVELTPERIPYQFPDVDYLIQVGDTAYRDEGMALGYVDGLIRMLDEDPDRVRRVQENIRPDRMLHLELEFVDQEEEEVLEALDHIAKQFGERI